MSTMDLIRNWADPRIAQRMFTDKVLFDALVDSKKIVFIASLWSGASQLAFRSLCSELSQFSGTVPPVLVLDADTIQGDFGLALSMEHGNGVILLYNDGVLQQTAAGSELERYIESLKWFLQHSTPS